MHIDASPGQQPGNGTSPKGGVAVVVKRQGSDGQR